jgi:microcystin-dependent protein
LVPTVTGDATNSTPVLTGISVDLRNFGLEGAVVEGTGVPLGATIVSVTATTITLSANANTSATSVTFRVFPHGAGDNATTFNLPDRRGRAIIGRDNMGGVAASRVTASGAGNPGVNGARLGSSGGVDRHTISSAQMPSHTHVATSVVTDPGHTHTAASVTAALFGTNPASFAATAGNTGSATTGITVATSNASTGGGEAHPNLPPAGVSNMIIFTGVV